MRRVETNALEYYERKWGAWDAANAVFPYLAILHTTPPPQTGQLVSLTIASQFTRPFSFFSSRCAAFCFSV